MGLIGNLIDKSVKKLHMFNREISVYARSCMDWYFCIKELFGNALLNVIENHKKAMWISYILWS